MGYSMEKVVTNRRKCYRQITISFIVVVKISEAQNPTKATRMSSLSCAPTQLSSKEHDD
jgi:hypothetical protein